MRGYTKNNDTVEPGRANSNEIGYTNKNAEQVDKLFVPDYELEIINLAILNQVELNVLVFLQKRGSVTAECLKKELYKKYGYSSSTINRAIADLAKHGSLSISFRSE